MKQRMAPAQSRMLKKPFCVSRSLSHSGFSFGGVRQFLPST
jgi:hypothetical protein